MSSALQTQSHITKKARTRAVTLATLGNVMEWYDFTVYGFLALAISANFFPGSDPNAALLSTFAVFGVGFVARPVGAFILGPLVDSKGRKFVMLLSMLLMAAGSLLVGIAPTYAQIGLLAPAIIVLGRLFQGFSAGGEFGSSAVVGLCSSSFRFYRVGRGGLHLFMGRGSGNYMTKPL
jgi:MFS transporter, MHS family, proline/betaine transporter